MRETKAPVCERGGRGVGERKCVYIRTGVRMGVRTGEEAVEGGEGDYRARGRCGEPQAEKEDAARSRHRDEHR